MGVKSYTKYIGVLLDDRYQVMEKIGEGGMAIVYKALDIRLNRNVAVKIVRDELFSDETVTKRFYDEAHAVARLSHPNIMSVYDVSRNDDVGYLVMELINGITLKQYLERKKTVPWKQVLHFSRQIADALQHAHENGIIHRDIKPMNIMLLSNGTIKVADFGIAAFENELRETKGQAIGSLHYIAPEQLRGKKPDVRGDVYSLAVTMYELLTGYKPYTGNTPAELLQKQTNTPLLPVRAFDVEMPDEFETILEKAMAIDPDERYQSAEELLKALNSFSGNFRNNIGREQNNRDKNSTNPLKISVSKNVNVPRREYRKSMRRSNRIGFSMASFALMASVVASFVFLWNFWLRDIFSDATRRELPNFIGSNYDAIVNDVVLMSSYDFQVNYTEDVSAAGTVLTQSPDAGKSLMITGERIPVSLTVSAGYAVNEVINVTGMDYREAEAELQNCGFSVIISSVTSNAKKDQVISTNPAAGEKAAEGSVVYVYVSAGEEINYVQMPNLIGLSENAAIEKLRNANLTYGSSERRESEYEPGTVIGQSIVAFSDVEELTSVNLTVSSGMGVFF